MLQAADNGLYKTLVPKAHNSECQNLPFPLQIKATKLKLIGRFLFPPPLGTKGLIQQSKAGRQ